MRGERGQASILIAIIFQILFVFFAMVINVGLLVHDKINLQNSTDIAAYYAAMKQAEVLNSMAQLNYQIHQAWKLFNWRLWVLADAGRNTDYLKNTTGPGPTTDSAATWQGPAQYPIVCVTNKLWEEVASKGKGAENLCANTSLKLQNLVPPNLIGAQNVFAPVFQKFINGITIQNNFFKSDFDNTGLANYKMAALFLSSFKIAAARRRFAIHHLQNFLVASSTDFQDLTGNYVKATTQLTLNNNLTASNKANGVDFEFQNGLSAATPFMVPIEVRVFVPYLDFDTGDITKVTTSMIKEINMPSIQDHGGVLAKQAQLFWDDDYNGGPTLETASTFSQEQEGFTANPNSFNSLIGFEKNPWVLAYVRVAATTHPKMLFSPITNGAGITLTAESYAMPFGGKMGPWYYDSWPNGQPTSMPGNLTSPTSYASPRMNVANAGPTARPNYSRYPGDTFGLCSQMARYDGLSQIKSKTPPSYTDYDFTSAYAIADPKIDPLVTTLPVPAPTPTLRPAEIAAVAPDLFDATYYSAAYDFSNRYPTAYSNTSTGPGVLEGLYTFDLGNDVTTLVSNQSPPIPISQIFFTGTSPNFQPNPQIWTGAPPFWILTQPQHLNTSWSQGDPGEYTGTQPDNPVGQTWDHTGSDGVHPAGGRAGYSVKLVSKYFLQRPDLPLGGTAGPGGIANRLSQ